MRVGGAREGGEDRGDGWTRVRLHFKRLWRILARDEDMSCVLLLRCGVGLCRAVPPRHAQGLAAASVGRGGGLAAQRHLARRRARHRRGERALGREGSASLPLARFAQWRGPAARGSKTAAGVASSGACWAATAAMT